MSHNENTIKKQGDKTVEEILGKIDKQHEETFKRINEADSKGIGELKSVKKLLLETKEIFTK
jgi:hypothetical protein